MASAPKKAVTVEATTSRGTERRRVRIEGETAVATFDDVVSNPKIDPDHELLLKR